MQESLGPLTFDQIKLVETNANRIAQDMFKTANRIGSPQIALQALMEDTYVAIFMNLGAQLEAPILIDLMVKNIKEKMKMAALTTRKM